MSNKVKKQLLGGLIFVVAMALSWYKYGWELPLVLFLLNFSINIEQSIRYKEKDE